MQFFSDPQAILNATLQAAQTSLPAFQFSGRLLSGESTAEDFRLVLLARDHQGDWVPAWNLSLEIYPVGAHLSLMIERPEQSVYPILWQGQHSVWMDPDTGQKVDRPSGGESLEWLARRLIKKLSPNTHP